jgi:predicted transcriptional regulator
MSQQNIEKQIQELITREFKSVRNFAKEVKIPYTTLMSIMSRGFNNTNHSNIIKICGKLNIEVDNLLQGKIKYRDYQTEAMDLTLDEVKIIKSLRTLEKHVQEMIIKEIENEVRKDEIRNEMENTFKANIKIIQDGKTSKGVGAVEVNDLLRIFVEVYENPDIYGEYIVKIPNEVTQSSKPEAVEVIENVVITAYKKALNIESDN